MIAGARTPYTWVRGHGRALLVYSKMPRRWWPSVDLGPFAVSLVDRDGSVLRRWTQPLDWGELDWAPVGRGFIGLEPYAARGDAVYVSARGITVLTRVRARRAYRVGDVAFGRGLLLDRTSRTVSTERLPKLCRGSATVDLRGRLWCLDGPRRVLSWTDDHVSWTRHRLSTGYRWECDGGSLGSEPAILADNVVIGLWRADFTTDGGRSWHDVALPFDMVGATDGIGTPYDANCTQVDVLRDGRLHLSYFTHAVATSVENTAFAPVTGPRGAADQIEWNAPEGILAAPLRHRYGHRVVSYDGGVHWRPLRVRRLVRAMFDR
ncbi:hypothetical protein GCM10009798_25990 [Nocardioides panacihumi]|uniref:Exo-alpha-sialidase n=1 Tax=Nocardioides panacihumi TaxID=400774 RepID=A0ABP5CJF6_9ACTN